MKLYNSVYMPTFKNLIPVCKFVHKIEQRHVISNSVASDKTSLDSDKTVQLLLSLGTPNDVRSVAQYS